MQLRYWKSIMPPQGQIHKITAMAWAPNNSKIAVATEDLVVYLYDEQGEKRDKFKTKAADSGNQPSYMIRAMAFAPDSTRLAIAQSDNIVFVYRVGAEWGDKKSICNKFLQSTSISALCWPKDRHNEIVFGLVDGKLKLGALKNNKPYNLYVQPDGSPVVALSSSPNGKMVVAGHQDGTIWRFSFPDEGGAAAGHVQIARHPCIPTALACGEGIAVSGGDCKVVFYNYNGHALHEFEQDQDCGSLSIAAFNPAGDAVVFGGYNSFVIYGYKSSLNQWEEVCKRQVQNLHTVTSLAWKPDGGKLLLASLTGGVDAFDVCIRRNRYKGKFEFTYVSRSSVIVKTLMTGARIVLKSVYGYEIEKINVYQDRFLVAKTPETLLMGDLETCKLSEIPWSNPVGGEKFHFENEQVCMIYASGELSLVEYGRNEILGCCRTECISPFWVSVVFMEQRGTAAEVKRIAYLVDLQTIKIHDLMARVDLSTIGHDSKVDWLELNTRGTHVLFRDKKRHLHLFDIESQKRTTLLNFCQYVQWVPSSDVVVAQSRGNLCVWYSIRTPDQQTIYPIKGEVEDIERSNNRTEVIVDEGINSASYALDESLIDFGSALEDRDFGKAIKILEPLELTPETEAQWQQIANIALQEGWIAVARRCYTAIGNIAKARYLKKVESLAYQETNENNPNGLNSFLVQAKLSVLNGDWSQAEQILLSQGSVDSAVSMYTEAHRWEDAIRVAETHHHQEAHSLKENYYQWLLETGQDAEAGAVKESEGDHVAAISLYLKGCVPSKAAQVVMSHGSSYDPALLESVCGALGKSGLHEKAGDLYQHLRRYQEAKDSFKRGHAYRKAVDLARHEFPAEVILIEEEWGDWLVGQKQMDAAINHYIESGQTMKAVEAALDCRQFVKASGIIEFLDPDVAKEYFKRIATHYEQLHTYEEAERYFIKADMAGEAVDMYTRAGKWDAAHKVAMGYLTDKEIHTLYTKRGRELEASGKFKEAERMYLKVNEHDQAINMYKKQRMYDQMIHLVSLYRKDLLGDTHIHLAQKMESDREFREAEKHYTAAEEWKRAVHMYRGANMWEDALRVAKSWGGVDASRQVAFAWATSLGGEEGPQLLKKLGLVDQAIDYALDSCAFLHAFQIARVCAKHKLSTIHLKYAMYLEDEGRFKEAEKEFISAEKPREAIDMYVHSEDWGAAMAVAEQYDPSSISDIIVAQGQTVARCKQYSLAESLFIKAKRPELALKMYRDAQCWRDALRIAEDYLPSKVQEIHLDMASNMATFCDGDGDGGQEATMAKAKAYERGHDYARAIETYLSLTTDTCTNYDALQKLWENAVHVAMTHQRNRMQHVVATVSQRLISIDRFEAAAELYEGIDNVEGAVKCYCMGGMFDKARTLARGFPSLNEYIEDRYNRHLVESQNADELASRGHTFEALEMFCQQGEWEKVHELAIHQGPDIAMRYAVRHAQLKSKQQEFGDVVTILVRHGISPDPANFDLYKHTAKQILAAKQSERSQELENHLVTMLHRLCGTLNPSHTADKEAFKNLFEAAHLLSMTQRSKDAGLVELAAKQATSLLRFLHIIPADKAFYEAGMLWKSVGRMNMAFVFLNRYLDLIEAMEEGDSGTILENADFAETDIPYDFDLPQENYIPEEKQEEVRNWVIAVSMDQQVDQSLSTRSCAQCGSDIYEACLICYSCKRQWEPCAVTGYPIPPGRKVCSQGNPAVVAFMDDWNRWVSTFHVCPVTSTAQTLQSQPLLH